MPSAEIYKWLQDCSDLSGYWYLKRLSGNDTQATGSHQAGPYVPKAQAFSIFPSLNLPKEKNPRVAFSATAGSHVHSAEPKIIWYNNRLRGGTRDEIRFTGFGGSLSPLLNSENTGSIAVFFFAQADETMECRYWVCRDIDEENIIESIFGLVEPGYPIFWSNTAALTPISHSPCWLTLESIPKEWLEAFPAPQAVFDKAMELRPSSHLPVDHRLLRRRQCETDVFFSVEEAFVSRIIQLGFKSPKDFLDKSQSVFQRRKSRAGNSLERHIAAILNEEGVIYESQATTELGNKPDFIFPSQHDYENPAFPSEKLRMLAVKTTVKERWRQILNEADRVPNKHLLTLQEGVSVNQFAQMQDANITLVVPKQIHSSYPASTRPSLMTLQEFLDDLRSL